MSGRNNKILYWLSPIIGSTLQAIILFLILLWGSKQENAAEPLAFFIGASFLLFILKVMIILTYGYLLLLRYFSRFFWLLSCIHFLIISAVIIYPINEILAEEKFLYTNIGLYLIEVVPFLTPVFIAAYKYVFKRS